jgi:hypothetical protein
MPQTVTKKQAPTPESLKAQLDVAQSELNKKRGIQPSVSANELANPPAKVTPPVPVPSTNDGSRTNNLVDNVTTNTQGFITSESEAAQKRDEIASLLGTQNFDAAGQREDLTEQFGVTGNLSRLQDIQTQLAKANTASNLTKVGIAGAAGQTMGQGQRELNQQDRENAVRTAGLAAEASVLQNNIETASAIINSAMQDFYADRTATNQNMINQLNYFSGIADEQTKQLLEQEKRVYEADQKKIERVLDAVDSATVSGVATVDEIKKITDPTVSDDEKLSLANSIVARRAQQEYNLDKAIKGRQYEKLGLEIDSENAKIVAAQRATEAGTLTPEQFTVANDLRKEVNNLAEVKSAKDLEPNVAALIASLEQGTGVGDIAAINAFQRIAVDPGVAVREGDVALLQSAQSFTDQASLKAKGLWKGDKLTPEARTQMLDVAKNVYKFRVDFVDENTKNVRTIAKEQGIDYGKYVGRNYSSFEELQSRVNPQDPVEWGVKTDTYLDDVYSALATDPTSNPFGVDLSNQ